MRDNHMNRLNKLHLFNKQISLFFCINNLYNNDVILKTKLNLIIVVQFPSVTGPPDTNRETDETNDTPNGHEGDVVEQLLEPVDRPEHRVI